MIEGLLRHCTDAEIEASYTDGASVVGSALTELLGFKLLPRLKNIGSIRLYRPDDTATHGELGPVLTRPIRWDLIAQQCDQMVKYATALRLGTAESESILRSFTRGGPTPPTRPWKNRPRCENDLRPRLSGIGRTPKGDQQRLQVVENWNSANTVVFYGKDSQLTGADREHAEVSMLAVHLLQSAMVHINTLLLQAVWRIRSSMISSVTTNAAP